MRRVAALAAVVALSVSAAAGARERTGAGVTTIATARGNVTALAQDARRVAWLKGNARCGAQIQVLTLPRRRPVYVGSRRPCGQLSTLDELALAGSRVLWPVVVGAGNTEVDVDWLTATLGDRRTRVVAHRFMGRDPTDPDVPEPLTPLAGDGRILAFYSLCDFEGCSRDESAIRRVVGRRTRKVGNAVDPQAIAVSGRRLAYVANNRLCCNVDPRFSPDGNRLAWSYRGDIYVVGADGANEHAATHFSTSTARHPSWSSDGTQIVFDLQDQTGANPALEIAAADGSGVRTLPASGTWPEWSPDGTKIAFLRGGDVYVIRPDGTGELRLTTNANAAPWLSWSPDSTRVAVSEHGQLWAVRADGLGATLVAATGRTPMWAPDGSKIAFAATGIWIANPNGTGPQQLSTSADDNAPAWSPDSLRLAFGHNGLNGELWIVNRDGTGRRRLLANAFAATPLPRWAPGQAIALGDDEEEEPTALPGIRLVAPANGSVTRVAPARRSPVVLRNAVSGRVIRAFTIEGHAYAIALGPTYVAMLVRHDATTRLELWPFRGTTPRTASVPANARDLSAAGRNVVFAAGRVIFRMRSNTGRVDAIAKRRIPPRSPVVEGRRLVWAENRGNRAWIRALTLAR